MSELIKQLASRLGITIREQGALCLIRHEDTKNILKACSDDKILILGIEAFKLSSGRVMPVMDLIADFSSLTGKQQNDALFESIRSAELFFKTMATESDLWFDFSLKKT